MTEWELKKDNGVLSQLERLSHFTYSVFPSSSVLARTPMNLYQRPTIPFDLECESRGITRDKVYGYYSKKNNLNGPIVYQADLKGYGFSITVLFLAFTWPGGVKNASRRPGGLRDALIMSWIIFNTVIAGFLVYPTITSWGLWGRFASMI